MGRQGGKRQVGAARRRSRGHGLARLDGTRPRATVADKVMTLGKMAGQATAAGVCQQNASEARRPEAGSRAVGVRDGGPNGAKPRRGFDAKHDSATGRVLGRGRSLKLKQESPRYCGPEKKINADSVGR